MGNFSERFKKATAEPRLKGMLITESDAKGQPPVGTLYPWPQAEYSASEGGDYVWRLHTAESVSTKSNLQNISLRTPQHRLALRACKRACRNAWRSGKLDFTERYVHRPLTAWIVSLVLIGAIAYLVIACTPNVPQIWWSRFHPDLPNREAYIFVLGLALAFLLGVLVLAVKGIAYPLWLELSGTIAASIRITSGGIEVDRRDGRSVATEWRDFLGIDRSIIRFRYALKLRLPRSRCRAAVMISAIEQELLPENRVKQLRAKRTQPWRLLAVGCLVSLGCIICLRQLSPILPSPDTWRVFRLPLAIAGLAPGLLLIAEPHFERLTRRIDRKQRRRERRGPR